MTTDAIANLDFSGMDEVVAKGEDLTLEAFNAFNFEERIKYIEHGLLPFVWGGNIWWDQE